MTFKKVNRCKYQEKVKTLRTVYWEWASIQKKTIARVRSTCVSIFISFGLSHSITGACFVTRGSASEWTQLLMSFLPCSLMRQSVATTPARPPPVSLPAFTPSPSLSPTLPLTSSKSSSGQSTADSRVTHGVNFWPLSFLTPRTSRFCLKTAFSPSLVTGN